MAVLLILCVLFSTGRTAVYRPRLACRIITAANISETTLEMMPLEELSKWCCPSSVRGIFPSMNTIVTNCDLKVATDVASSNANAVVTFIYFTLRKHLYDVYGKGFNRKVC
jgi:hypothetical protein